MLDAKIVVPTNEILQVYRKKVLLLQTIMKQIEVVAAIIRKDDKVFATQRGYGEWKDWWEFPGGKVEPGETPEAALKREIREELSTEISVDTFVCTVDYDYPKFHLTMHCYYCSLLDEALHLNEHEAARWLTKDQLDSVDWLPADLVVVEDIKKGEWAVAADSSHYDYKLWKTNLAAKVHGFLQTTKNNRCFVLQDAKIVVPTRRLHFIQAYNFEFF